MAAREVSKAASEPTCIPAPSAVSSTILAGIPRLGLIIRSMATSSAIVSNAAVMVGVWTASEASAFALHAVSSTCDSWMLPVTSVLLPSS